MAVVVLIPLSLCLSIADIGRVYHNAHIIRDSKHKNFQPLPSEASNGYNDSKQYLPFAAGSGYLLTEPLVRYIAK